MEGRRVFPSTKLSLFQSSLPNWGKLDGSRWKMIKMFRYTYEWGNWKIEKPFASYRKFAFGMFLFLLLCSFCFEAIFSYNVFLWLSCLFPSFTVQPSSVVPPVHRPATPKAMKMDCYELIYEYDEVLLIHLDSEWAIGADEKVIYSYVLLNSFSTLYNLLEKYFHLTFILLFIFVTERSAFEALFRWLTIIHIHTWFSLFLGTSH